MKFVLVLLLIFGALYIFAVVKESAESPKAPTYATDSPRATLATYLHAVKRNDRHGISLAFENEGYGMNALADINSYVTPGVDQFEFTMPIQEGGASASGSAAVVGTDGRLVTTIHFEMKKVDDSWKITGISTVGGMKKEDSLAH